MSSERQKVTIFINGGNINEVTSNGDVDISIVYADEFDHSSELQDEHEAIYDKIRENQKPLSAKRICRLSDIENHDEKNQD